MSVFHNLPVCRRLEGLIFLVYDFPSMNMYKKSLTVTNTLLLLFVIAGLLSVNAVSARDWDKEASVEFPVSVKTSDSSVSVKPKLPNSPSGLEVDFELGGGSYPGVTLTPTEGETWDFSGFTCLEFRITSTSEMPIYVTARVDNPSDWREEKWNYNAARFLEGDTKLIRVFFGYGAKGPAYPLDPSKVSALLVFTGKAKEGQSFTIDSIRASKVPVPFKPDAFPKDGVILSNSKEAPAKEYSAKKGATVSGGDDGESLRIVFDGAEQSIEIKPKGDALWNFKDGYRIVANIKNTGSVAINPGLQVTSQDGDTQVATATAPIASGQTGQIELSFIQDAPSAIVLEKKTSFFDSNDAKALVVLANGVDGKQEMEVESVHLDAPAVVLPEWIGKRPPVDGDWKLTFSEEFEGTELDRSTWNVITPNFWDKVSRFSKDNVEVKDGRAVLTFEKKRGHHGDDPSHPRVHEYTTGYLDTYGKWVQRYGYYEARMKLPTENGLWPAFWLMPDLGLEAGEQWRRQSINTDGMEFDIMEYLSGWGAHRFTTAFHWDGYGKNHKATGVGIYSALDEEGYITTGLLWLPGLAVIYNNGEEVTRWDTDRISTLQSNIIFTFVAGGWDNTPIKDAELPATFEIDYVRVWQRADLASDVDGVQSSQATLSAPTTKDE